MTVETDTDRAAMLLDFGVPITRVLGGSFTAVTSEDDGLTLDGGTNADGTMQLLAVSSAVADSGLSEGDSVTISGATFVAAKIDSLGDGMDVIHCEPV